MTDIKQNYISPIPTREEFHREYAGEITAEDFCTEKARKCKIPHYTQSEHMAKKQRNLNQYTVI